MWLAPTPQLPTFTPYTLSPGRSPPSPRTSQQSVPTIGSTIPHCFPKPPPHHPGIAPAPRRRATPHPNTTDRTLQSAQDPSLHPGFRMLIKPSSTTLPTHQSRKPHLTSIRIATQQLPSIPPTWKIRPHRQQREGRTRCFCMMHPSNQYRRAATVIHQN